MLTLRAIPAARRAAPARRRRTARGAVLSGLLAVVAANLALAVRAERNIAVADPGFGDKAKTLAAMAASDRDLVLALGTSRTGFGFHGEKFEAAYFARTGRRVAAFNFGAPASGPVTHLLYSRRLAARGIVPKHLILEVLPSMLGDRPDGPLEHLWANGDRLTHAELEVAEGYGFPAESLRAQWRGGRVTPWYGLRFQLLSRYVQSWIPWHRRYDWGRGTDRWGWVTPIVDAVTAEQAAGGSGRAAGEYGPVLSALRPGGGAGRALDDTVREAQARGTKVTLVWMPEGSTFRALYPPPVEARIRAFVSTVCAERGCEFLDARLWVPDDQFTDGHHLLRGGAVIFSERLAAAVKP